MWRPLLFEGARRLGCLCRLDPLRERVEPCAQRRHLLLLPIHDIAELDVGALQERYFRLDPLDCIAVHPDSVTNRRRPARPLRSAPTIESKLVVSLYRQWPNRPVPKRRLHRKIDLKCLFFPAPRHKSNIEFKTCGVARRRRSLPAAIGRLQFHADLWSVTGNIVSTGNIKTWPHRHRFTAEEYNWMAEIGLLNGEAAVELIEGEIIHMAPMGTQHGNVVERLHAASNT